MPEKSGSVMLHENTQCLHVSSNKNASKTNVTRWFCL
jgi:hypothetical protein